MTTTPVEMFLAAERRGRRRLMLPDGRWSLYKSVNAFVLQLGRSFSPVTATRSGAIGHCFKNSLNMLYQDDDLTYVEGYACGVIPVHHAWVVDPSGRVLDSTWTGVGSRPPIGTQYYGVPFNREYVLGCAVKSGVYGILWNFGLDWSFLADKPGSFLDERHARKT